MLTTTHGLTYVENADDVKDYPAAMLALVTELEARLYKQVATEVAFAAIVPTDGMVVDYTADAANGIVWRFRYRAAAVGAYKWEFIGGKPLRAVVDTAETINSAAYAALATAGPSITAPLAGEYDVELGAFISGSTAPNATRTFGNMSFDVGGTAAIDADSAIVMTNSGTGGAAGDSGASVVAKRRKTIAAAATALVSKYKNGGSGNVVNFQQRFIELTPVRVAA